MWKLEGNALITFSFLSRINFISCLLIVVFIDEIKKQVERRVHAVTNLAEKYMVIEI